jgi:MtN3 and saliva related transmembrane protein
MNIVLIIGSLAAALTTVSFLPQVIKAHNTRHTKDLSLAMYALTVCGLAFWLVYGLCLNSLPIILANAITLVLCSYTLYLKIKYG